MTKEDAEKYLRLLGQELQKQGVTGEILVHDDIKVLIDIKIHVPLLKCATFFVVIGSF